MREKSIKTRQGCFSLLTQLTVVLPGALTLHLSALVPGIQFSLGDSRASSSSNMKIDTLTFIQHLLVSSTQARLTIFEDIFLTHERRKSRKYTCIYNL